MFSRKENLDRPNYLAPTRWEKFSHTFIRYMYIHITLHMEVKRILWSCLVVLSVGYFGYHELTFVTVMILVERFIPAKRSDGFHALFDKPEVTVRFHRLWMKNARLSSLPNIDWFRKLDTSRF